jgi:hypothetical protein
MMKTLFNFIAIAAYVGALGASAARAQQQPQDQTQQPAQGQSQQQTPDQGATQAQGPIPAYRSPLAGAADNDDEDTTTELAPDTRPITGVQNFSLGTPMTHSYWQPHVDVTSTVDSNPTETTGTTSNWGTWTSISGGIDVHRASPANDLELSYVGGEAISNNADAGNGVVQELSFSDKYVFRRWDLSFYESLNYLPESSFGFNGLGAGAPGGGLPGGGTFTPGQTLLTGRGQNLGNAFETEADVFLSPRASLTFIGGYTNLDYFDSSLLNYGSVDARVGYNYQLDRSNSVGVDYTFVRYDYSNFNQSITSQTAQLTYGRRVTGRLAFQIAAGPEINSFQTPISTNSGSPGGTGGGAPTASSTSTVGWSLNTSLQYQLKRSTFALSYTHGLTGGSGIQAGAESNTASGSVTRRISRTFTGGITGGYSRSSGLTVISATTPFSQTFDYWYGGGNLAYALSRTLALSFSYQLQYQDSGAGFCVGTSCGTSIVRHMISFGVNWRERPLLF